MAKRDRMDRMVKFILLGITFLMQVPVFPAAANKVDNSTLKHKLIMGYQGWWACPGDGSSLGWGKWKISKNGIDVPGTDMLPDMTEYPKSARCHTDMKTADGREVYLFSSQNPAVVDLHFRWLEAYGIDGVALERFTNGLTKPDRVAAFDRVLQNVRQSAERHGRVFFVMYDLSGTPVNQFSNVSADWERLEREGLTRSSAYLRHRGHPVLGLWGLGWAGSGQKASDARALISDVQRASQSAGGATLLGGVPTRWNIGGPGMLTDAGWKDVWRKLGVISPWSVGRFADDQGADIFTKTVTQRDIVAARQLGVDYMPVIFPGFSWENVKKAHNQPGGRYNAIPRRCGEFFWHQASDAFRAGADMLYAAMFDEVNESTAMFKVQTTAADAPHSGVPEGTRFVSLDADGCQLPSDWYLRLTGSVAAYLRTGQRTLPPLQLPR